jgi:AAA domain
VGSVEKLSRDEIRRRIGLAPADNQSSHPGSAEKLKAITDALPEVATSANNQPSKSWRDDLITAAELQTKQFKPVRIVLPRLIPEGVTILAGKPKVGKSWLALDVCLAVADENRFVLGNMRPVHGDVLYLALEDNQRRLKWRTDKIVQSGKWPERLEMHTEWRRLDQGGLEDAEAWLKSKERPRLLWIDTLPKIRPLAARNEQAYAADYRAIEGIQKLCGQYGIAAVLNCHLRKAVSEDDPFDDVSGTLGLTGAADTIIVMKRHSGMVKIFVRGRDIEEAELAAQFNRETCRWRLVGEADDVFRSQERTAILAALKDAGHDKDGNPNAMSVAQIMAATERTSRHGLDALLYKMRKDGEIAVVGRGLYALPRKGDPLKPVEIVEKGPPDAPAGQEGIENVCVSAPADLNGGSQRDLNGVDSVEIPLRLPEASKPLEDNGNAIESQHLNDLNGIEHRARALASKDPGPFPDFLRREVPLDRRPALGPEDDSLDDLK